MCLSINVLANRAIEYDYNKVTAPMPEGFEPVPGVELKYANEPLPPDHLRWNGNEWRPGNWYTLVYDPNEPDSPIIRRIPVPTPA